MDHSLLVLRPVKRQAFSRRKLHDTLAESGNVTVAKDAPDPFDNAVFNPVTFRILLRKKSDKRLAHRQARKTVHSFFWFRVFLIRHFARPRGWREVATLRKILVVRGIDSRGECFDLFSER
jgi:hypothetical protein